MSVSLERSSICLNMIVRNEAHIITETLNSVVPFISTWVIVDTGSDDGTQDLIRGYMKNAGLPGELYESSWRNFGDNRTEALTLAQGRSDYIWVIDADDVLIGAPDFTGLSAHAYACRYRFGEDTMFWRPQLFRNGMHWRYRGAVHEQPVGDPDYVTERLCGDYHIEARCLGARSLDLRKHEHDRDLLLGAAEHHPDDVGVVSHLARNYFGVGDFVTARDWYARRVAMGGSDEGVFHAMFFLAESIAQLGTSWKEAHEAYLEAWKFRPSRAEPLHGIAVQCREHGRYQVGYDVAKSAAQIPFPTDDDLVECASIYTWRCTDEQAICASWIGKHPEAFMLCRQLLERNDLPEADRQRISRNRDVSAPYMLDAATAYPAELIGRVTASADPTITISVIAGPDKAVTELTLNSFLHCCTDLSGALRFLVLDAGLSAADRAILQQRYEFLEFAEPGPAIQLAQIRPLVTTRFWLHLGQGWRFFAPEDMITRLTAVLAAENHVSRVGLNLGDAHTLTGESAPEQTVRRAPGAGRYVLTGTRTNGPAMFDTNRLDQIGSPGWQTATLDEVLAVRQPSDSPALSPVPHL